MKGKVIDITEGMFSDILIIKSNDGKTTVESRGFVNGRDGLILDTGDSVEFDVEVNSINNTPYAKNIKLYF